MLVKDEDETDDSYGSPPEKRPLKDYLNYGILNLDKPAGPTSSEVVAWVKRIMNLKHAGHGGTLDPQVTGVLPVALEEATKIIRILLFSGKEYVCIMRLHKKMPEEKVIEVTNEFVGEIYQRPPLRSSVRRVTRKRRIYYISNYEFDTNSLLFRIGCQAGTYIRKICFDIGEALGSGAHMEELRRTRTGPFTEDENLVDLYSLQEAFIRLNDHGDESMLRKIVQPMENSLKLVGKIYIRDSAADSICHGANLAVPGVTNIESGIKQKDIVGIFTLKGELVALARAVMSSEDVLKNEHGIVGDTLRVTMKVGTYPRIWPSSNKPDSIEK